MSSIQAAIESLKSHNINALSVKTGEEAKAKVLEMIPAGAEVLTMTSVTLDTIGLSKEINESDKYVSVRNQLNAMDRKTHGREMQKMGAAPEYAVGSVHAVTEDGSLFIASNTGSQLPAYAYGADHVIWVVGSQKVVADKEAAIKRLEEYVLPLESERARKAYGVPGSAINKLLIINAEANPERLTVIFVDESLGY